MDAEHMVSFSVRIEPELRAQLERAAEADRRPVTQLIRNVLHDFVATYTPKEHADGLK
jgi:predicted transcriptional regulator